MIHDLGHVILSYTLPYVVSPKKRKEKKRSINNDLAILPTHDKGYRIVCKKVNKAVDNNIVWPH